MKKVHLSWQCAYCGSINGHVINRKTKFHCLECGRITNLVVRASEGYEDII